MRFFGKIGPVKKNEPIQDKTEGLLKKLDQSKKNCIGPGKNRKKISDFILKPILRY